MFSGVCRVCIAGDVRLLSMDSQLLELYEKLINAKLSPSDEEKIRLCFFCYSQLQKCLKFTNMALKSEKYFKVVLDSSLKVSTDTIHNMLNLAKQQTLSVFIQKPISLDGTSRRKKTKHTHKNIELNVISTKEVGKEEVIKVATNEKEELIKNETPTEGLIKNKTKELATEIVTSKVESTKIETEPKKRSCKNVNKGLKKFKTQSKLIENENTFKDLVIVTPTGMELNELRRSFAKKQTIQNVNTKKTLVKNKLTEESVTTETKQGLVDDVTDESANYEITEDDHVENTEELIYFDTNDEVEIHEDITEEDCVVINDTELYYECDLCTNIFKTREDLEKHQPTHTVETKPIYKLEDIIKETPITKEPYCPICKKFFAGYDSQLQEHLRIHTGERPFVCDLCGKTARTKHHLKEHIRTHTKEKVYCKICEKGYTQMSSLGKHMLIHTGESPYCCHVCGKSFRQNGQMKAHIRFIHDGVRRYGCDVCGKRFPARSEWRRHMDGHIGKKSHSCDQCGSKFATNAAMVRHKKKNCKKSGVDK